MKEIKNLRVDYSGDLIDIKKLNNNPIKQFEIWFEEAKKIAEDANIQYVSNLCIKQEYQKLFQKANPVFPVLKN